MLDTGQVIADRYELLKQLGRGGFSEVWLALDKLTDVKVAIKIYAPGMGLDDAGISLFTQEFSFNAIAAVLNPSSRNICIPSFGQLTDLSTNVHGIWNTVPILTRLALR